MSFTIKKDNSRVLKVIVETLASIIDETEFRVSPKEFTISAMDPSRICLLKLSITKDNFEEYKCSKETKVLMADRRRPLGMLRPSDISV